MFFLETPTPLVAFPWGSRSTNRTRLPSAATAAAQFLNSYSKTLAARELSAAEIYPVLQGANLIASAVLARILLKEPITKRCILGITLAFIGVILMKLF